MKKTFLLIVAALAFVTCKKTVTGPQGPQGEQGPQGAQGPAGATANGSIYGKITITDPNVTTATVSLANTTISVIDQTVSAVTDAKGNYTIANVAPGMLDLVVTTVDGTVYKWQQYPYPGSNKLLVNMSLSKKITEPVSGRINDTLVGGKKGVFVRAVFTPSITGTRGLTICFGSSNKVSPYDPSTFSYFINYVGSGANLTMNYFIDYDAMKSPYIFTTGQQIFITAHPLPAGNYSYYDAYEDSEVYYTAGAAIAPIYATTVQ